jgi:peptidoglycan biosynthesis protein MviN/MurJ (putative lipid II flippase)
VSDPRPAPPRGLVATDASSARASLAVSVGFLLTSLIGGVLNILVAIVVGEGADTDAFFAAYSVYLFFTLFGAGLRTSLVPLLGPTSDESIWRRSSADVVARLAGASAITMALVVVVSPLVGVALRPGDAGGRGTAIVSVAILAVASYCQIAGASLASVLASARRFGFSAGMYVAGTATSLVVAVPLMYAMGVLGAPIGVLVGAIVILLGHRLYLRSFAFTPRPEPRSIGSRRTWFIVAMAGAGTSVALAQQVQLTLALVALSDRVGAVTAYTYANFLAGLLASVTIYVVAFVMLPGVLAVLEVQGVTAALGYLDFAVPVAYYLYVPAAAAYAAFGRPVIDDVLGTSLSPANLDVLWDASRIFLVMHLVSALMVPAGAVLLAMRRYRAIVVSVLAVFAVYVVALAIAWSADTVTIAIIQAAAGASLVVPLLALGFGRPIVGAVIRVLWRSLPVAGLALVFPLLAWLTPAPSTLTAAVGLSIVGLAAYVVLGFVAWPAVGRRAVLLLVSRG